MDSIDWLLANIVWIIVVVAVGLACLAVGYYTAATDLREEKRKAFLKGYQQGSEARR